MPNKPVAWSFSALSSFQTCPRKHYETKVIKTYPDEMGEAGKWGNYVHQMLDKRIGEKQPLPENVAQYESLAAKFDRMTGEVFSERKITLNKDMKEVAWFAKDAWLRVILDISVLNGNKGFVGDWKGLCLDTDLPTPTGWTTMRDVVVGDQLFDAQGDVCRVTAKSDVHYRSCYRLTFDDGTTVVCDDEHVWPFIGGNVQTRDIPVGDLKSTGIVSRWRIPVTAPLQLSDASLPIHPYVLGLWLGDGKHTSGEVCKPDDGVWAKVQQCGYSISEDYTRKKKDRARTHTIKGLRTQLRLAGLLGNKHIPAEYLRASFTQRLELLQGLMDSDGNVNAVRKQAVFTTCDKQLSDQVVELLLSLGQRPQQDQTTQHGFGLTVTAWPIAFKPLHHINPFTSLRKADRVTSAWGTGMSWRRLLKTVERIPTVPTQCITVDSPDHTFLCTRKMLPTHNTGKRKLDIDQLKLFAAVMFTVHPHLEEVQAGYIWLKERKIDKEKFYRRDLPELWQHFAPQVRRLVLAHKEQKWPEKPSGLCKNYCPVVACEFNGRKT